MCSLESLGPDLRHHRAKPQQAARDVRAVAADQREEGREERAALRRSALGDHRCEFVKLDRQEDEAKQAGHEQPDLRPASCCARLAAIIAKAADEAREQQGDRFHGDQVAVEQLAGRRPAVGRVNQRRVSREQRRKQHHVRKDEQPEPVRDDRCSSTPGRGGRGRYLQSSRASGRWPVLQFPPSCRLAQICGGVPFECDAARAHCPGPPRRDDVLMLVAPGVPDEDCKGADEAEDREPPDVPDEGKAADRSEEGDDDAGRRVRSASRSAR